MEHSKFEKAREILNEYYPAWQTIYKEVWSIVFPNHGAMLIKYTIDLNELGTILEEENLVEKEWLYDDFKQIK